MDVGRLSPQDEPVPLERWDELVAFMAGRDHADPRHRLFVRRGRSRPARGGGVHDEESGTVLPGLPALSLVPEPWWPGSVADWVSRQLSHHLDGRTDRSTVPLLRGRVVGRGWDGEVLLAGVDVAAVVGPTPLLHARRHYRALSCGRWPEALPGEPVDALYLA